MFNTSFHGILTGKSIYSIILVIEGHLQGYLQGQKVNLKVKGIKKYDFYQTQIATQIIFMFDVILI